MCRCLLSAQVETDGLVVGRVVELIVSDVVFEAAESVAEDAEEAVAVVLLVEIVIEAEAHVRRRRAEDVARLSSFAFAVANAKLRCGEEFVENVDSGSDLHVCELGSEGLHGKADEVGADSNAAQQRSLLLLLRFLLGMSGEAGANRQ